MSMNIRVEKVSLENKSPAEIYQHIALQKLSHDYLLCKHLSPESYESLKAVVSHIELLLLSVITVALREDKEMFESASKTVQELVVDHIKQGLIILNGEDKKKESMI